MISFLSSILSMLCLWNGCNQVLTPQDAITHTSSHITTDTARCLWAGCNKAVSGSLTEAHVHTHLGEVLFCIVPECHEHFLSINELGGHIRAAHDLHPVKPGAMGLLQLVQADHNLRTPWWYSPRWLAVISAPEGVYRVKDLMDLPYDLKQHRLAHQRYRNYVCDPEDELLDSVDPNCKITNVIKLSKRYEKEKEREKLRKANQPFDTVEVRDDSVDLMKASKNVHGALAQNAAALKTQYRNLHADDIDNAPREQLAAIFDSLQARLSTASRINKSVGTELARSISEKRRLWLINQLLLDSNVNIGLPPVPGEASRVMMDDLDDHLLS